MNKTKIILLSIGGVALVGTLVFAFLIWSSWSEQSENAEEIENLESEAQRLTGLKVFPGDAAVKAVDANRAAYAEWNELTMALASAGDRKAEETTPAAFKAFIAEDARRIAEMPGAVNGHFAAPDFDFGSDYLRKDTPPAKEELPTLQREWHDVIAFLELLVDAKATGVSSLKFVRGEEAKKPDPSDRKKKSAKKKNAADEASKPYVSRFDVVFTAPSSALVAVLNALAASPRFMVAETLAFARSTDEIAQKLGGRDEKKAETGGRRRRRGQAAEEQPKAEVAAGPTGPITDPAAAPDFKVTMRVAVYDFRTAGKQANEKEESK